MFVKHLSPLPWRPLRRNCLPYLFVIHVVGKIKKNFKKPLSISGLKYGKKTNTQVFKLKIQFNN